MEYVRLVKGYATKFNLIKRLKGLSEPISLEELKGLSVAYYSELDNEIDEIPIEYAFEDHEEDSSTKENNPKDNEKFQMVEL